MADRGRVQIVDISSVTLECLAFVATWLALEFVWRELRPKSRNEQVRE